MSNRAWQEAMRAKFAEAVGRILKQFDAGELHEHDAFNEIRHEYEDKISDEK